MKKAGRQRIPAPARSPPAPLRPQEGVTSQTSHWSRLYFMTFYIVTMVGRGPQSARRPLPSQAASSPGAVRGEGGRGYIWPGSGAPSQLTPPHSSRLLSLCLARW